jgi:HEAT repeat protein
LLRDREWRVRRAAAFALWQMGPEAKAAIPALTRLLQQARFF